MASAGSIVVDLLARTGSFQTDMDRAAKSAKKRADEIDKALSAIGTAAATAGAAAAGALALLVNQTMNSAREIERQAQISNASADAFQTMAYGARTVGIEQDKLSDILKDVNDRVGDFLSTGGGPMKDFFEQIAPKVGVTADQFARLSGPEALQLYVSSLEKAGVSQQEMTFYLEAMASDTTALIPLLASGGREMAALGEEARRTGQIMSDETIAAASELKGQMDQLSGQLTGAKNIIAGELIPVLGVAATEMISFGGSGDVARTAAGLLRGVLQDLVVSAAEVAAWFQVSGKTLGGWAAQAGAIISGDFAGAKFIGQELDKDLAGIEARLNVFRGRVSAAGTDLAGALGAGSIMPAAPSLGGGSGSRAPTGCAASAPRASSRSTAMTEDQKEYNRMMQEGARIYDSTRTAAEKLSIEFGKLNELRKSGAIDQDTYNRAVFEAQENFDTLIAKTKELAGDGEGSEGSYWEKWLAGAEEALTTFDELANNVIENFSAGFGSAFEAMVFDAENLGESLKGMAEGMTRSVVNALGQMAAQWLAYQAVQMLVGKTTQASASGAKTFEAMAAQQMAALNAFAATAAIPIVGPAMAPAAAGAALAATSPFVATVASLSAAAVGARADGGPVSQGMVYLVGERGPELFVPGTSGAVVPNNKMGGGNVTVNLIEDKRRAGQTQERDNNGARELDVFVADIMGDGPRSKAIRQAFGLQRRGY